MLLIFGYWERAMQTLRRQEMKTYLAVAGIVLVLSISGAQAQTGAPLKLIQTIPLPNVEGYFDHMAVDVKGHRLFFPGGHHRAMELVDVGTAELFTTIMT